MDTKVRMIATTNNASNIIDVIEAVMGLTTTVMVKWMKGFYTLFRRP